MFAEVDWLENPVVGEVLCHLQLKPMTARHISCTSQRDHQPRSQGLSSLPPLSLRKDPG